MPSRPSIRFEAWEKERLSLDELPTVRDVLARADLGLLADAIAPRWEREASWADAEPPSYWDVMEGIEHIVGELFATPEIPADDEWLLPSTTVLDDSGECGTFRAVTESVLVRGQNLAAHACFLEPNRVPDTLSEEAPPYGWAYELRPWEEILSFRVHVPTRF